MTAVASARLPRSVLQVLVVTVCLTLLSGCDPSVTVVTPSDQHKYSVFGTLNVAADTQTVRVDPLLDSLDSRSLNATVVLKNLDSGHEVTFQDSTTVIAGKQVHNAWAHTSIQPSTSYRLSIQENGESVTTATFATPSDPPQQVQTGTLDVSCGSESEDILLVSIKDPAPLAGLALTYKIQPPPVDGELPTPITSTFPHFDDVTRQDGGYLVRVSYPPDLVYLNPESEENGCADRGDFVHPYAKLMVATGGPNWPDWIDVPLNEMGRPDAFSNVTGGHGYVGGIYPDTFRVPLATPAAQ